MGTPCTDDSGCSSYGSDYCCGDLNTDSNATYKTTTTADIKSVSSDVTSAIKDAYNTVVG